MNHDLPLAILKACGVPADRVVAFTYSANVHEVDHLTVTYIVGDGELEEVTKHFVEVE